MGISIFSRTAVRATGVGSLLFLVPLATSPRANLDFLCEFPRASFAERAGGRLDVVPIESVFHWRKRMARSFIALAGAALLATFVGCSVAVEEKVPVGTPEQDLEALNAEIKAEIESSPTIGHLGDSGDGKVDAEKSAAEGKAALDRGAKAGDEEKKAAGDEEKKAADGEEKKAADGEEKKAADGEEKKAADGEEKK